MALATYKDLCIDAVDAHRLGRFWADALALELHEDDDGGAHLTGPTPRHTVWVNTVPEPKTVKHRLHIDLFGHSATDLVALGAELVDDSLDWTVLRDPESGELCVFEHHEETQPRRFELVLDCGADAGPIAAWWSGVLGGRLVEDEKGYWYVEQIPEAPFGCLAFVPVPEPKTVKNRIHLDVTTDDLNSLLAAGATLLRAKDPDAGIGWHVLADPDGNEFCAFTSD